MVWLMVVLGGFAALYAGMAVYFYQGFKRMPL
jgi:hypothetical protein